MTQLRELELAYIAALEKYETAQVAMEATQRRHADEIQNAAVEIYGAKISVEGSRQMLQLWIRMEGENDQ